jgi:hypothetical protein
LDLVGCSIIYPIQNPEKSWLPNTAKEWGRLNGQKQAIKIVVWMKGWSKKNHYSHPYI